MRRHHTGSGRRTALASDWEAYAGAVMEQFMLEATVWLRKAGGVTAWDDGLKRSVTTPYAPFATGVKAKITPLTAGGNAADVVDEQVWVLGYRVVVPRDTAPTAAQLDEGVEILVVTCPGDTTLAGRTMRVNDVVRGTHQFTRVLYADTNS